MVKRDVFGNPYVEIQGRRLSAVMREPTANRERLVRLKALQWDDKGNLTMRAPRAQQDALRLTTFLFHFAGADEARVCEVLTALLVAQKIPATQVFLRSYIKEQNVLSNCLMADEILVQLADDVQPTEVVEQKFVLPFGFETGAWLAVKLEFMTAPAGISPGPVTQYLGGEGAAVMVDFGTGARQAAITNRRAALFGDVLDMADHALKKNLFDPQRTLWQALVLEKPFAAGEGSSAQRR